MYSRKENVNQLTALLVKYGIRNAVVCPGSRNAPVTHNLVMHPDITCHSAVDERSAGFYALGLCLQTHLPTVVCVTSGTALLNLSPAVAEAFYLHQPLIVISADRPASRIDQQEGQTLPQPHALGRFVRKSVTLPEPVNDEQRWYTNRLINEALIECTRRNDAPIHINVPISEPLFDFSAESLPDERRIRVFDGITDTAAIEHLCDLTDRSQRPMIVIGQTTDSFEACPKLMDDIAGKAVVVRESLTSLPGLTHIDEALYMLADDTGYRPDFVVYLGGDLVSKRLRSLLRRSAEAQTWIVNPRGEVYDTFANLQGVLTGNPLTFLQALARHSAPSASKPFIDRWTALLQEAGSMVERHEPDFSQMFAVKAFEERIERMAETPLVHYANSNAIRLANIYSRHAVHCNRGVNGIDGSLSTAAGASLATSRRVFCVIGDLSFFYDGNALWNRDLRGNFRIVLLNNSGGGIFSQLPGLDASPARDAFVAACHHTSAEGLCRTHDIGYMAARTADECCRCLDRIFRDESDRPVLLEVFTDAETDTRAFRQYYHRLNRHPA